MITLYGGVEFPQDGPNLDNVERIDLGAMPMTLAMMQTGLQVDLDHFARMDKALTEDMERVTQTVQELTGTYINLGSGDQVSELLHKKLGLKQPRPKMTKSGDRESVDYEALVAIQHDHEVVPMILDYKEFEKLRGTYVRPLPKLTRATPLGSRLYPNLGQSRVPSGRFNCKEPNLLAFPTRTKRGKEIRRGFITQAGWVYLSVDFSQFEPRACAHYSEDAGLIEVYETQQDVYSDFAIAGFRLPDERYQDDTGRWVYPGVDKDAHRFPSKTCFLAAIYDVTAGGLLEQMPVICAGCSRSATEHTCGTFTTLWTEDKCQEILNALYLKYPGILRDRKRHHGRARRFGYIWDLWGRLHHVAAVRSVHPWVVAGALRETGNFPYQGLNSGALKLCMAQIQDEIEAGNLGEVLRPLLPIHDELLFECRADMAEELGQWVVSVFENCVPLRVPVKAEYAYSETWGTIAK